MRSADFLRAHFYALICARDFGRKSAIFMIDIVNRVSPDKFLADSGPVSVGLCCVMRSRAGSPATSESTSLFMPSCPALLQQACAKFDAPTAPHPRVHPWAHFVRGTRWCHWFSPTRLGNTRNRCYESVSWQVQIWRFWQAHPFTKFLK